MWFKHLVSDAIWKWGEFQKRKEKNWKLEIGKLPVGKGNLKKEREYKKQKALNIAKKKIARFLVKPLKEKIERREWV